MSQQDKRTILIVDDSESDRSAYVRYLQAEENFSYQIIETDTLEAGLESWERNRPDLVLLDINLPDGNGLDFLVAITQCRSAIAQIYLDSKLPIIVMTGQADTQLTLDALKLGASDYLFKEDKNPIVFRRCVAQTINQLDLSRKLERSRQQETLSGEIALRIRTFLNLEDIYQAIVREVRAFLNTDRVIVYRFNPDMSGQIVAESVLPPWEPSLHAQVMDTCLQENQGIAYQQGKIFAVSDIYASNLTDCHLKMLESFQVRANLVVPILLPTAIGQKNPLWGLLIAHQCSGPRSWETDDLKTLQNLSVQLAIALQQSIAYEQLQNELADKKRAELTLQKLIVGTSSVTGEAFFPVFVQNVAEALQVRYALITEVVGDQLHALGFWANGALQPSSSFNQIHTPCEYSLRDGEYYCEKLIQELFPEDLDLVTMQADSYLGVALKDNGGKSIGNLCVLDIKPISDHKRVEAIAILKIFAARASAELQQKQANEKLQQLNQYLELQVEQRTAALQESDLTNRTILEAIPDLLLRLRSDGTCLDYMEPRVERENFLPIVHHISEVLPPEILQNILQVIGRAIATKQLQVHEHSLFKHHRLTYEEIRVLAINDQEVLVIVRDISDRKQAEENLKTERLRLQLALDAAKMGAWSRSSASDQLIWSDRAQEIFGFVPGTFSGNPETFLAMIHPEDRDRVVQSLAHTFATGEPYHLDYRIFRLDGEMRWITVWAILTEMLSTDERQLIGVIADISDRKQAEKSLQEKNTELEKLLQLREEALELREDMSNMIVHDLRTPLTTITLAAGLINQYGDRVGQRALIVRKAGQILDSAKQLEKMIDGLLFMAKLESGKILFSPIPTDLHYLGAEVIEDFELVANSREIELRSELPNLGETILVDATILRRIIDNLMTNAIKFSPVGGQVILSLEYLPENRFRVKVTDTGTGIDEAERQKIFEKFEIGSLKRDVPQTGLGLAFCKMAVEAQGGTLAIIDNYPQGVIFTVEI